jgi:outer membrane protein assembly factor BamA
MTQRVGARFPRSLSRLMVSAALGICGAGCVESIPKDQYGIDAIRWRGVEQMSSQSLASCLATKERGHFTLKLGRGGGTCGKPPFDSQTPALRMFAWPWTDWPAYDPAIFDVDCTRIERWFEARGFYQAKVVSVRYSVDGKRLEPTERCSAEDCELEIEIEVAEGKPVHVGSVELAGDYGLDRELRAELRAATRVKAGERFDETDFEADKEALTALMKDHSFALAKVDGTAEVDRDARVARVRYTIEAGPFSTFGTMRVEGNAGIIGADAIMEVAGIEPGDPFEPSVLRDAEAAVAALGVFSSVRIDTVPRPGGGVIDLVTRCTIGRLERWRLGIGMLSGSMQQGTSDESFSVPQWDIHLRAAYSHEHFLGGMRKLKLEERPRVIMLDTFPLIPSVGPQLGNTLTASLEQPRFIEPRTVLFVIAQWDYGPSPFLTNCEATTGDESEARPECVVFRHDLQTKVGVRRKFWDQKITAQFAIAHDLYEITGPPPMDVSSYRLPYFEQGVRLDLRNDSVRPSEGFYLDNLVQEAVRIAGYGSWNYVRWLPDARAYQPLMWKWVLAERFALGALFIDEQSSDQSLDPKSLQVGPDNYRLRGGGANGNRGFSAGRLGVGINGGNRRWEASLELRVPIGESAGLTLFFDVGDVNDQSYFRWKRLNASTGIGFRYFTSFAPIRFDAGWRIPGLQGFGDEREPQGDTEPDADLGFLPSAIHITIGEAF